ncbi:hypothetical protein CFRS1_v015163 [Colletotrichum fructicola]|nr:hypothetical protein CFRS1_v015163 [Colletotrichum fructicola]
MASVGLPPPSSAEQQARDLGMPSSVYPYRSATKHPEIAAPATVGPHTPNTMALSSVQHIFVRPAELRSTSQHPRYIGFDIGGDVGAYLATIQPRAPPSTVTASKVDGSISVCDGDEIQTGWVDDYFGLSDGKRPYGGGFGWESQEADMMESPRWPRKFGGTLKGTCTIGLDAAASCGASLGFTRPLLTMQYYLDHDHTAAEPCVRGLCQQARDSLLPGCCDGNVAESPWESAYSCVMDHCDVVTDARHKMRKHLNGNTKKGHGVYVSGLAGRIKNHDCLSSTDQAVSSRLMGLFNDLDSRGQIPMSQSVRTVLGADKISSPAVLGEHRQWMVYLGLHAPETFKAYCFGATTEK